MYHSTETARAADLLLPAAGWGEKEGTFINSERRIGLIKKVRRAPGQALVRLPHLQARRPTTTAATTCSPSGSRPRRSSRSSSGSRRASRATSPASRDYHALDAARGIQWPYPAGDARPGPAAPAVRRRPVLPPRRPRPVRLREPAADAPRSPTTSIPLAAAHRPRQRLAVAHADADGQVGRAPQALSRRRSTSRSTRPTPTRWASRRARPVIVESRRGQVRARAFVSPTVPRGQVFLPMHDAATNRLTFADFDPYSRQPAYKACAVRRPARRRRRRVAVATSDPRSTADRTTDRRSFDHRVTHLMRRDGKATRINLFDVSDAADAGVPPVVVRVLPLLLRVVRDRPADDGGPRRDGADEGPGRLVHHRLGGDHGARADAGRPALRPVRTAADLHLAA